MWKWNQHRGIIKWIKIKWCLCLYVCVCKCADWLTEWASEWVGERMCILFTKIKAYKWAVQTTNIIYVRLLICLFVYLFVRLVVLWWVFYCCCWFCFCSRLYRFRVILISFPFYALWENWRITIYFYSNSLNYFANRTRSSSNLPVFLALHCPVSIHSLADPHSFTHTRFLSLSLCVCLHIFSFLFSVTHLIFMTSMNKRNDIGVSGAKFIYVFVVIFFLDCVAVVVIELFGRGALQHFTYSVGIWLCVCFFGFILV